MATEVKQSESTHVEFRRIGPPGTGKTTWIVSQALRAAAKHVAEDEWGDGRPSILFSSLTKAAAGELTKRGMPIPREAIGTLHAHAYRALGRPKLCIEAKALVEFNAKFPQWSLSGDRKAAPDQGDGTGAERAGERPGDKYFERYAIFRARLTPRQLWPAMIAAFAKDYEQWKYEEDVLDFTDVINNAFVECPAAPGAPKVIFVDEAQDHDRAELRLIRRWAERAEHVVLVGDPDQCLYEWRGSDPEAFYEHEIPDEHQRVLAQSYRVPRAVHAEAMAMIARAEKRRPVEYLPRDADGDVSHSDLTFSPKGTDDLLRTACARISSGQTVMFSASCDYLLRPLMRGLKDAGEPFWNPFAKDRYHFNPLHPSKGTATATRLLDFMRPSEEAWGDERRIWTAHELWSWVEICHGTGWLRRGAKQEIERLAKSSDECPPLTLSEVRSFLSTPDIPAEIKMSNLDWLMTHCAGSKRDALAYARRIYQRRGPAGLKDEPRVIVGTIHSVKGGEADAVYLSPDLSPQGYDQFDSVDPDQTYRLFYVGMTRAKESLVLCDQQNQRSIEW